MLVLLTPNSLSANQIQEFRDEFARCGSVLHGCSKLYPHADVPTWMNDRRWTQHPNLFQFFSYDTTTNTVVGCIRLNTYMDAVLVENHGGNVGYSIRPSMRRKGYAVQQLGLGLKFLYDAGLDRALVGCDRDNVASLQTIKHFSFRPVYATTDSLLFSVSTRA